MQARVGVSQNLRGGSSRLRPSIHVSVPPCGLGRPYVIVLAGREFIQTLEKLSRKAGPRLWIQSEGFSLYFFYAHVFILHDRTQVLRTLRSCRILGIPCQSVLLRSAFRY